MLKHKIVIFLTFVKCILYFFQIIFGTGDQLKCVTVSANSGFVRAAEHQVRLYV
jgi:hypothetical protein